MLLQQLHPFLIEGIPVVGLEPSTVAVLRDEMPNLMPHDMDVQRLSQKAFLLSEFLDQENVDLPQLHRQAVLAQPRMATAVAGHREVAPEEVRWQGLARVRTCWGWQHHQCCSPRLP